MGRSPCWVDASQALVRLWFGLPCQEGTAVSRALPFPALVSPRGTSPEVAPEPWIRSALGGPDPAWGSWWGRGPVQRHSGCFQMKLLCGSPLFPSSLPHIVAGPTPCSHTVKPSRPSETPGAGGDGHPWSCHPLSCSRLRLRSPSRCKTGIPAPLPLMQLADSSLPSAF